ncbi:MAG: hypothetical protein F4207_10210 [Gemmatimonadetes bacterium]|nr:hypothetical protein [Gemmatimonadota bacterium]MYG16780.1 hypothetical protein [Gemmatimonadota bacterium]
MKRSDNIKIEMSKARERLAVLSAKDDATDEEKGEMKTLTESYADLEARYQAAIIAEDEESAAAAKEEPDGHLDAESREFHEKIVPEVNAADYFTAAVDQTPLDGATKEFSEALGVDTSIKHVDGKIGVSFPLYMLDPPGGKDEEYAATSLTIDTIRRGNAWLARVFLDKASEYLGVTRRMVPKGEATYPVISSGASPATTAVGTAKDEETLNADASVLEPRSIRSGYQVSNRDLYRLGDEYEAALRRDLRDALSESMDSEIVNGVSGEINGFLNDTDISKLKLDGTSDGAQATESTAAQFVEAITAQIDGRYAGDTDDVKVLVAPEVLRWLWKVVRELGTTDSVQLYSFIKNQMNVMVRASDHIGAVTGSQFYALYCKARGSMGAAIHAVWNDGMILVDPYGTNKTQGYTSFYISGFHDFALVRHQNWAVRRVTTT